jgi:hypothetical protein
VPTGGADRLVSLSRPFRCDPVPFTQLPGEVDVVGDTGRQDLLVELGREVLSQERSYILLERLGLVVPLEVHD